MRTIVKLVAAAVGVAIAFVLTFRFVNGLDLLTGDDPRVIAALRANPSLEITSVPKSYGIYEIVDRAERLKAYIDLPRDETLAGPLHLARCRGGSRADLPDWIPRFPHAGEWICAVLVTNAGERRHASFLTSQEGLDEAFAFYDQALETMKYSTGGQSLSRFDPWSGMQFRHDVETGRHVSLRYFYDDVDRRYGPFVTIAFVGGR